MVFLPPAQAQDASLKRLDEVVVSASRTEQRQFDAPAPVDAVQVDALRVASPLVNLSELLGAVPGIQLRERQNYAQDLQLSIRGFGARSTFGVRGVRILIDGIPATMPDGQGQVATISLPSAERIEILRGPVAQLYGNAAGGVLQAFSAAPPLSATPVLTVSAGAGGDAQRQAGASIGGGTQALGALLDVNHFETDGYRAHSAATRTLVNAKMVARPAAGTTLTGIFNGFDQPRAQDPMGLTRAQFEQDPRQAVPAAFIFDTRKRVAQQQAGMVLEHKLSDADSLHARVYAGARDVFQTLGFSGSAASSAGGVVDLANRYRGAGISWTRRMRLHGRPLSWTAGLEADRLDQARRGFVNEGGAAGELRRDERDRADNLDLFGQLDWALLPQWKATAGVRASRVRFAVDDRHVTAASPDDSGRVKYRNTSPVLGLVWHAGETVNVYGNIGRGFETPTLVETAYRADATGPNLDLQPARSLQREIGFKLRGFGLHGAEHALDVAFFHAASRDEIVPLTTQNGRAVFQNVDQVVRRGVEAGWKAAWRSIDVQLAYTLLDARFRRQFVNAQNATVAAGNRVPGVPQHSLFAQIAYRPRDTLTLGLDMRAESRVQADDLNSDAAPGHAVVGLHASHDIALGKARLAVVGRLDNLFDRHYAGSVIVNEGSRRFFEPAAERRLFVGVRGRF